MGQVLLFHAPSLARLAAAAYHEAGHAVVAQRVGYRVTRVHIKRDGSGSCSTRDPCPELRQPADWLDVLVAGPAAQARYTGRWDWHNAQADLAEAIFVAAHVRGWSSRTRSPRARVGEAARWIFRLFECDADLWRAVTLRADGLLARYSVRYGLGN